MRKLLLTSLFALIIFLTTNAQGSASPGWINDLRQTISIVENKGQFDLWQEQAGGNILYGLEGDGYKVFFTEKGVSYFLVKRHKNPEREEGNHSIPKYILQSDWIQYTWEGASASLQLQPLEPREDYQTYSVPKGYEKGYAAISDVKTFDKVVYQNVYPGIDVTYTVHPKGGIEYQVTLHPGADPSQLRMCYDNDRQLVLEGGQLKVSTVFGSITETAPYTTIQNGEVIPSRFQLQGHILSFNLDNYDQSQTVIIDPWVQMPSIGNSSCMWECEVDTAGNVYAIGGELPMRLLKYDNSGALQWTYNSPWDTSTSWLGTLATDDKGNSFITSGSVAAMQKVDAQGNLVWSREVDIYSTDEYWSIAFNCYQNKLIVGGTRLISEFDTSGPFNGVTLTGAGMVFYIEPDSGYVVDTSIFAHLKAFDTIPIFIGPNEIRSICAGDSNQYYFLTFDTIGRILQDSSGMHLQYTRKSEHEFYYKSENFRQSNGNSGIEAIAVDNNFLYTQNGTAIYKRSLVDAAVIDSVNIPGGASSYFDVFGQPENMGIAVDDCGNVYVGSAIGVMKYDNNLNLLDSTHTPMAVYDVEVAYNGEIIATGGTGSPSNFPRDGYIMSLALSACQPYQIKCGCSSGILNPGVLCSDDTPVNLQAEQPGGAFQGTGITNAQSGLFDPSVAGTGTHLVTYSPSCNGIDSVWIEVLDAPPSVAITGKDTICKGATTVLVASGAQHYNWNTGDTTQVVEVGGGVYYVNGYNNGSCTNRSANFRVVQLDTMNVTVNLAQPSSINANDGAITLVVINAVPPNNVLWSTGDTTLSISGLSPGSYTVTISNGNGCDYVKTFVIDAVNNISLDALDGVEKLELYPNPSDNVVYLNLELSKSAEVTIKWYDFRGREVFELQKASVGKKLNQKFNFSGLADGTYVVKVTIGNQSFSKNVSIVR